MPTGNNEAIDVFPDSNGNNNVERYVDISVHPGDGGWGVIMDFQGYKQLGRVTAFGSSTWLANPRDTNGTASRGNIVTAHDAVEHQHRVGSVPLPRRRGGADHQPHHRIARRGERKAFRATT